MTAHYVEAKLFCLADTYWSQLFCDIQAGHANWLLKPGQKPIYEFAHFLRPGLRELEPQLEPPPNCTIE
ncbi:hypothetical protein Y045_5960 [Burkholderia pseudomallei MSHR2451]|nr:hypothetical protein X990_5625 [Burkholderia pseudomallei MSHR4868]KGS73337.1 hypothetical protein X942_5765 [Burkholderia pseudomallei MSHR5596]KGW37026.1 hypothetical protein Y045_5960 [Burkholderia pseudomallei MSHR2451]